MGSARLAASAAAALALLIACSGESPVQQRPRTGTGTASTADGVQQITVTTGGDYRFHPSTLVVHPGPVKLVLVNEGGQGAGAPHNWSLTGFPAAFVPLTRAGQENDVTFTAPAPGSYNFLCTIHKKQGQTGKLIVENG